MSFEAKFYSQHKSLSFDDVLIQPTEISYIKSRLDPDLTTKLTRNVKLRTPIIASPMDRVVNYGAALQIADAGGTACFHRFQQAEEQLEEVGAFMTSRPKTPLVAAISAQMADRHEIARIEKLAELGVQVFIIDTAMGTNITVLEAISLIKKKYPKIDVIAGNIVTPEGAQTLINAGADGIRAGIGNGSACITRLQTGCGRGQLTVLIECADVCKKYGVSLISDGGHFTPGDFAKAIAAGADVAMMGSPLAGHDESPGKVYYKYQGHYFKSDDMIYIPGLGTKTASAIEGLPQYKQYRGMASKELQIDWKGGVKPGTTHEGIEKYLKLKGPLKETLNNFIGGLRSSMSYCNSASVEEFHTKAKFEKLTFGSQKESYVRSDD